MQYSFSKQGLFGLLVLLMVGSLPAAAVQVQGGKPLARGDEPLRPARSTDPEGVTLHGVVEAVDVEAGVVTLTGQRLSTAGVPLHGARGDMALKELQVGHRVRVALGGPPNRRQVLEMWVLP